MPSFVLNLSFWTSSHHSENRVIVTLVSKQMTVLALGFLVFSNLVSQDVGLSGCVHCFPSVSNHTDFNFNSLYYRKQPVLFNSIFSSVQGA